tara:strand:+ start:67 stop:258 length:192 start_codon:yes stop_codon:yes gene_type:complete
MSQNTEILKHLETGKGLTQLDALELFGCMRLAARIDTLRKRHDIMTHLVVKNGKAFAEYRMIL